MRPNIRYRQKKREEAEEADKVEVEPGVTVASLRPFRAALIGPTHGWHCTKLSLSSALLRSSSGMCIVFKEKSERT